MAKVKATTLELSANSDLHIRISEEESPNELVLNQNNDVVYIPIDDWDAVSSVVAALRRDAEKD